MWRGPKMNQGAWGINVSDTAAEKPQFQGSRVREDRNV